MARKKRAAVQEVDYEEFNRRSRLAVAARLGVAFPEVVWSVLSRSARFGARPRHLLSALSCLFHFRFRLCSRALGIC